MNWRVTSASVLGTSHLKSNTGCQDSHAVRVCSSGDEDLLFCVVSDGAGSAPRSSEGSRRTCDSLVETVQNWWDAGGREPAEADVRGWLFEASAAITALAEPEGLHPKLFACTVVGAVVGGSGALYFQVGDGGIVTGGAEKYSVVFWPADSEALNLTDFLTDEHWPDHLQIVSAETPPSELALFTDGIQLQVLDYANRSPHSPFFQKMFAQLSAWQDSQLDQLNDALTAYLSSEVFNDKTDDDKTLVLAAKRRNPK